MTSNQVFGDGFMVKCLIQLDEMNGGAQSVGQLAKLWAVTKPTARKWADDMVRCGEADFIDVMSHGKKARKYFITYECQQAYYNSHNMQTRVNHCYSVYKDYIKKDTRIKV